MKIFKLNIIYISVFLITFFFSDYSHADKIKEFKIIGNERLAKETIILFSEFNIGDEINQNDINNSFKKLFDGFLSFLLRITSSMIIVVVILIHKYVKTNIKVGMMEYFCRTSLAKSLSIQIGEKLLFKKSSES